MEQRRHRPERARRVTIHDTDWKFKASTFLYAAWHLSEPAGGRQEPIMPYPGQTRGAFGNWLHHALDEMTRAGVLPQWFAEGLSFTRWGYCRELNELLLWWGSAGIATAGDQRGFLLILSSDGTRRYMARDEIDEQEAVQTGHGLRLYARGQVPAAVEQWKSRDAAVEAADAPQEPHDVPR